MCSIATAALLVSVARVQGGPLLTIQDPQTFAALAYYPSGHAEPLPLLLYLHGAGESGTSVRDIISEGATGTPPVELEHGSALPILAKRFIVVAPQTDHGWPAHEVHRFLDYLLAQPHGLPAIDPARCYITGHSMGGAGALAAAAARPYRFAAVAAVAPAGAVQGPALRGTAVWLFHGSNDVVVPSHVSERLHAELKAAGIGDDDAKLTLYERAPAPKGWPDYDGHGSPMPAYATPELYRWLLGKRRAVTAVG